MRATKNIPLNIPEDNGKHANERGIKPIKKMEEKRDPGGDGKMPKKNGLEWNMWGGWDVCTCALSSWPRTICPSKLNC